MANVSVTYSFTNATVADATQVNQNFTDIINGTSDGTKDFSISALTCAGTATFNGNIVLGNASGDTITATGRLASDLAPNANTTYDLGTSTLGFAEIYIGGTSTFTTKLASLATASWTFTFPATTGVAGQGLVNQGSGTMAWIPQQMITSAKSADYTVTDTDMIRTVLMTTAGTDRVVTLPTAADNTHRCIKVKKIDSGTGKVTVKGEAAGETIDDVSGTTGKILYGQYDEIDVQCDGTEWWVIDHFAESRSQVRLDTANGLGSTSTAIRRFANTVESVGTAITYADSATLGGTFTINKTGVYAISYTENQDLNTVIAISVNQSDLTASGLSLPAAQALALFQVPTANHTFTVSWCGHLTSGDVVRACAGAGTTVGTNARTRFSIAKVL